MFLLFASLTVGLAAGASDEEQEKGKGKDKGKGKGSTDIVQVDLNKLHPGIAQYIRDQIGAKGAKGKDDKKGEPGKGDEKKKDKKGEGKKAGKEITLVDAINIASRTGTVVKAERKGEAADATFKIEVRGSDGAKTKLNLDAFGRSIQDMPKKGDEKGKGKGKGKGE